MPKLKHHGIGNSGLEISELGLGTVKFGRNTDVKYPANFEIPSLDELSRLLDLAQNLGINYLDTAPAYGTSEETLGRLNLAQADWIISTKVGEYFENNQSTYDFSRDTTIRSVESSLSNLGRAQLDIVYVHSNGDDERIVLETEVLSTLNQLKEQSMIKAVGFSGKTVAGSALALELCDIFMITLNEQDQSQTSLIQQCHALNKAVVIKKALGSGHSDNPNQSIRFANQFPGVTSTIVGTINASHLEQNVAAILS